MTSEKTMTFLREESHLKKFIDAAMRSEIKVVSFDFFDTLMSRRVARPTDLFTLLGKSLSHLLAFDVRPERFAQMRIIAEERARSNGDSREIDIYSIYRQFPENFFKAGVDLEKLVEAELTQESLSLFPMSYVTNLMHLFANRGKRIIVVSDTYFSSAQLKRFFYKYFQEIEVSFFTSSEYGTGKYSDLFPRILKRLKIKANEIVHVGDNFNSDVKIPASLGISAHLLPNGSRLFWNLFNDEGLAISGVVNQHPELGDFGITALRAKVCVHLSTIECDKTNYLQYGAQILGPALSVFIAWARASLKNSSIKYVLPLMREGYTLNQLINQYSDVDILKCPTYLSRRMLFQASLASASLDSLRKLRFENLDSSIKDYLKLINIRLSDLPELRNEIHKNLSDNKAFEAIIKAIDSDNSTIELIRHRGNDIRLGILRHLKELVPNISDTVHPGGKLRIAVVDVGWNATIQRLLQEILDDAGWKVEIHGYYMMTTPGVVDMAMDGIHAKGLYIDAGLPTVEFRALSRTLEIFEQSCAPAFGSALSHDLETGAPRVLPDSIPSKQRENIIEIQKGIALFNEMFISYLEVTNQTNPSTSTLSAIAPQLVPILRRAMCTPNPAEVRLFLNWMHDDNLASGSAMPILGEEIHRERVRFQSTAQYLNNSMSELYWPSGALALVDPSRAKMLNLIWANKLDPTYFDHNFNISSEFANSISGHFDDATVTHHNWVRNLAGLSYLRFELPEGVNAAMRWTLAPVATEVEVRFIVITFKPSNGRPVTRFRIESDDLPYHVKLHNLVCIDSINGIYRSHSASGSMYFYNLRELGIVGHGSIHVEIGCRVNITSTNETSEKCELVSSSLPKSIKSRKIVQNLTVKLDMVNSIPLETDSIVAVLGENLVLYGWVFDSRLEGDGTVIVRLATQAGESLFIVAERIERPDVNAEFKVVGATGFTVKLPKMGSPTLPTDNYFMSILLATADGNELAIDHKHYKITSKENL